MRIEVEHGVRLFVDIDGSEYRVEGARMRRLPTLILLHGGPGMDHSSLKAELGSLRDVAQLVYIDHRGNGRSDAGPREAWNLARWGDDVKTVCDVLGIESPIVLGQSFGGFVAQSYATRHPAHPRALILSSTAARANIERNLAVFERLGGIEARESAEDFYRAAGPGNVLDFVSKCMSLYNRRFSDPGGMRRSKLRMEVLFHFFNGEYRSMDLLADLSRIACPTLILGGEDDPTTPIEDQLEIGSAIGEDLVELHRFADCGHGAYRDCPDDAIPLMRNFILKYGVEQG